MSTFSQNWKHNRSKNLTRHDHTQQFSDDHSSRGDKASSIMTPEDGETVNSYPKSNPNDNVKEVQAKLTACKGQCIPTNIDRQYVNERIILPNEMELTGRGKLNRTSQFDLSWVNNDQANRGALTYRYVAQSLSPVPYGTFTEYPVGTQLDSHSGQQFARGMRIRTEYGGDPTQMQAKNHIMVQARTIEIFFWHDCCFASGFRNGSMTTCFGSDVNAVYREQCRERRAHTACVTVTS